MTAACAAAAAHFVEKCSCGKVIAQCRCTAPDKAVRVTPNGCASCKTAVAVFPAEEADGVAALVRASASVSFASAVTAGPTTTPLLAVGSDLSLPDLYPLDFILASTGPNRNDDWFDRDETWAARETPAHKPFDYEHLSEDVVGHIRGGSRVLLPDGAAFAGDAPPDAYHLACSGYLYRHWPTNEGKQARTDRVIADIDAPPDDKPVWFVSMECRFKGFDYCLVPAEGKSLATDKAKYLARGADTAFLTKHLRAYGGSGSYKGFRVFRVLRNMVFSGVGLVKNPANPASVILRAGEAAAAAAANISDLSQLPGYGPDSDTIAREKHVNDTEKLQAQVADLTAKLAKAEADAAAAKSDAAKAEAAQAAKQVAELTAARDAAKAEADAAKAAAEKAQAEATAAKAEAEAAKAELAKAAEAAKAADRVAKVKASYGFEKDEDAAKAAESLKALPDDAFDAHLKTIAEYKTKSTPAPAGEAKVTGQPAPMGGGAKKVAAAKAAVDDAEPTPAEPALVVAEAADDEVQAAAAEMLEFFDKAETKPAKPAKSK